MEKKLNEMQFSDSARVKSDGDIKIKRYWTVRVQPNLLASPLMNAVISVTRLCLWFFCYGAYMQNGNDRGDSEYETLAL